MLKEQDIIDRLQRHFPLPGGIGDDAAILPLDAAQSYVITKDVLAEDVHFRRAYFDAASLAHKALHVNLSDVAAMGARPLYVMLGLSLPPEMPGAFAAEFLEEFSRCCKAQKAQLIGGDTTASPRGIFISVTAIGIAQNDYIKRRSTARAGDIVCICGTLGDAYAGLMALEKSLPAPKELTGALLKPNARVKEGLWFGQASAVTAMMDVSDGLYVDLGKLCRASKAGSDVLLDQLRPSEALTAFCRQQGIDLMECMLAGGDDYGLLLTVRPEAHEDLAENFKKTFGYSLLSIGKITATGGVRLLQDGRETPFTCKVFSHFGE